MDKMNIALRKAIIDAMHPNETRAPSHALRKRKR